MRAMDLMSSPAMTVRPGTPTTEADASVQAARTTTSVAVAPAADAAAVARVLLDRHLDAVPVVDGGRLVGIVTRSDVLRTLVRDDADIARDIRQRLAVVCMRSTVVDVTGGVVTLATEGDDPKDQRLAEIVAAARPGVLEVRFRPADQGQQRPTVARDRRPPQGEARPLQRAVAATGQG